MDSTETLPKKKTEEKLKPKLFSVMKNYTKEQFLKDVISGIIVAIIALPLSIALALASGVSRIYRIVSRRKPRTDRRSDGRFRHHCCGDRSFRGNGRTCNFHHNGRYLPYNYGSVQIWKSDKIYT